MHDAPLPPDPNRVLEGPEEPGSIPPPNPSPEGSEKPGSLPPVNPAIVELYADFLGREEAGEGIDIETYCREKVPEELRDEIRKIHALSQRLGGLLPKLLSQATRGGSVLRWIQLRYGPGADPGVSLGEASEDPLPGEGLSRAGTSFTEEALRRLGTRPDAFGRYTLKGEIAQGGMGAILRVWDEDLRRNLAMKVVLGREERGGGRAFKREEEKDAGKPEAGEKGEGQAAAPRSPTSPVDSRKLARFLEEAQVTGQLDHPGIVPVHELGLDPQGRCYFTMKLVRGRDLREILELTRKGKEGWSQTRALGVLQRVCEAMAYAHAKGVVHRDLKPANIMVGRFGEVYVMDWGLARVLGKEDLRDLRLQPPPDATREVESDREDARRHAPDTPIITMDGAVVGTPAYMPPEQASGKIDEIDRRSDVYALGAILYHIVTGQMPYVPPGARVTAHAVLARVVEGSPRPVAELAPSAPAELVAICEKAMARKREDRYADTTELARDLRAFLEGRVVTAYETGAWPELKKWVQRNRALAAAIAAAVVILAGASIGMSSLYVRAENSATLARASEAKARVAREKAEAERDAKQKALDEKARALDEVLRLADVKRLEELQAEEESLWPAYPEKVAAMEGWLTRARELAERLPAHEASLD